MANCRILSVLGNAMVMKIQVFGMLLTNVRGDTQGFYFLIVVYLGKHTYVYHSIGNVFTMFLAIYAMRRCVVGRGLFACTTIINFGTHEDQIVYTAHGLGTYKRGVLSDFGDVYTVGCQVFAHASFNLVSVYSFKQVNYYLTAIFHDRTQDRRYTTISVMFTTGDHHLIGSRKVTSGGRDVKCQDANEIGGCQLQGLGFLIVVLINVYFDFVQTIPRVRVKRELICARVLIKLHSGKINFKTRGLGQCTSVSLRVIGIGNAIIWRGLFPTTIHLLRRWV